MRRHLHQVPRNLPGEASSVYQSARCLRLAAGRCIRSISHWHGFQNLSCFTECTYARADVWYCQLSVRNVFFLWCRRWFQHFWCRSHRSHRSDEEEINGQWPSQREEMHENTPRRRRRPRIENRKRWWLYWPRNGIYNKKCVLHIRQWHAAYRSATFTIVRPVIQIQHATNKIYVPTLLPVVFCFKCA